MKATIKGFEKGRYTEENRNWLKENIGKTFEYEKHNINYVRFSNGFLCHIYECYCGQRFAGCCQCGFRITNVEYLNKG